jgi:hypothetical protein
VITSLSFLQEEVFPLYAAQALGREETPFYSLTMMFSYFYARPGAVTLT